MSSNFAVMFAQKLAKTSDLYALARRDYVIEALNSIRSLNFVMHKEATSQNTMEPPVNQYTENSSKTKILT